MENPAPKDAILKGKWQVSKVPPGSTKTVACVKRSVKMDRFYKFGTLNSGGPECVPAEVGRPPRANCDQPQEDAIWTSRESDPPIVVRDGNAGHRAKEWAGSNASTGTTTGHEYSRIMASNSLLALGAGSGTLCRRWFRVRAFLRSPVR